MTTNTSSTPTGQPGLRASDTDREQTVTRLRSHYETGHLGYDEFSQRMDAAYHATYTHELAALLTDLPYGQRPVRPPAPAPQPRQRMGAGRVALIVALVIGALAGLSWVLGLVGGHPFLTVVVVAVVVWLLLKRSRHGHNRT